MQCPEFREVMSRFIDGDVDGPTRKQIGLHLAGCEECLRLIEDERFWDDAVLSLLDREAPEGLREEILDDFARDKPAHQRPDLSTLSRQKQWKIIGWAATRKNSPRLWLEAIAYVVGILLLVQVITRLFG